MKLTQKEMLYGRDYLAEKNEITLSDLLNYGIAWYAQAVIMREIQDGSGADNDTIEGEETERAIEAAFIREQAAEIITADLFYGGDRKQARALFGAHGVDSECIPDDLSFACFYPDSADENITEVRQ